MKKVHDVKQRKHYYLVHGAIVFAHVEQEQVGSIDMNGLLLADEKKIALHELNNSQRILQHNFFQRMPAEKVEIQDVVLKNLTWLGHYTDDEFKNIPEGVTMQMREAAEQAATPTSEQIIDSVAQAPANDPVPEPRETPVETPEVGEPQPVIPDENPDRINSDVSDDSVTEPVNQPDSAES